MIAYAEAFYRGAKHARFPPFPQPMQHVWECFIALAQTRSIGMAAGPITFMEMWAYREMTGADLSGWEVGIIRRLDAKAMEIMAKQADGSLPHPNAPTLGEMLRGKAAEHRARTKAREDAAALKARQAAEAAQIAPAPSEEPPAAAPRPRRRKGAAD